MKKTVPTTSLRLNENLEAMLCYLCGWVTGIIFLLIESRSRFVKYHAMQSVLVFLPLFVLRYIVCFVPVIGSILVSVLNFLIAAFWIYLMYKAYRYKYCNLPLIEKLIHLMLN